jgi:hypothetical protein
MTAPLEQRTVDHTHLLLNSVVKMWRQAGDQRTETCAIDWGRLEMLSMGATSKVDTKLVNWDMLP